MPRREDVVAAQSDEQSRARNKRMFGSLLGTLNKFCQDESRLRGRVEKKAIIEKKVEEQELREREMSKLERRNLFVDRKKKLMEVRLLEIKMERMQDLSTWEENQKKTREFIRTKAGPKIFFLPKVMHERTTKLLQESQQQYNGKWWTGVIICGHTDSYNILFHSPQRSWLRSARPSRKNWPGWKSDLIGNWKGHSRRSRPRRERMARRTRTLTTTTWMQMGTQREKTMDQRRTRRIRTINPVPGWSVRW